MIYHTNYLKSTLQNALQWFSLWFSKLAPTCFISRTIKYQSEISSGGRS